MTTSMMVSLQVTAIVWKKEDDAPAIEETI